MIIAPMVVFKVCFDGIEEMVEDYQHEGKKSFALGKCMYSKAYSQFKKAAFYAERLPKTPENLHLLATLYGNCSLIQMKKDFQNKKMHQSYAVNIPTKVICFPDEYSKIVKSHDHWDWTGTIRR